MVKFSVDKKSLERATALLNQVATLKSEGVTPSESSGLVLTPGTISLSNLNEANGVLIEHLPITVLSGDINQHVDLMYMLNTKKLDNVVKGSGATVFFSIDDSKIAIGENKRRYELAMFSAPRRDPVETKMLGYKIKVKDVVKNLLSAELISNSAHNTAAMAGSLFTGTSIMATDKIAGLYIEFGELFGEGVEDLMMSPDLFATCLGKSDVVEAEPGFTEDGKRFVLKFNNVTLYKTLIIGGFPKTDLLTAIGRIKLASAGDEKISVVRAVVNIDDFKTKLKEIHSIVEAEEYNMVYNRGGYVQLGNHNAKGGAEGVAIIDAQVTMPSTVAAEVAEISALYTYAHLDLVGKLFANGTELSIFSALDTKNGKNQVKYTAVHTPEKTYFFIPLAGK